MMTAPNDPNWSHSADEMMAAIREEMHRRDAAAMIAKAFALKVRCLDWLPNPDEVYFVDGDEGWRLSFGELPDLRKRNDRGIVWIVCGPKQREACERFALEVNRMKFST